MKSSFIAFIAIVAATLLASTASHAAQNESPAAAADTAPAAKEAPRRVLPLDHGPRAQSTPWLNEQTRQREAKAAAEAARMAGQSKDQSSAGAATN